MNDEDRIKRAIRHLQMFGKHMADDYTFAEMAGDVMVPRGIEGNRLPCGIEQSSWQPIETALRDGSWILLAGGRIDDGWDYGVDKPAVVSGQWADSECWQFARYDGGYYGEYEDPTHWMPLPDPPVSISGGK